MVFHDSDDHSGKFTSLCRNFSATSPPHSPESEDANGQTPQFITKIDFQNLSLSRKSIFRRGLFLGGIVMRFFWDFQNAVFCVRGGGPSQPRLIMLYFLAGYEYIHYYIYIKLSYTIDIYLHIFAYPITVTVSTWKKPRKNRRRPRNSGNSARGKLSPPYSPPRKVKDKSQAEPVPDLRPSHGEW